MLAPRTLDDLVLSPEGEAARAAALAAIVDGIPVDLPPLPPEPPEPEPVDPVVQARRERHRLAMGRAFPAARYYGRTTTRPGYAIASAISRAFPVSDT